VSGDENRFALSRLKRRLAIGCLLPAIARSPRHHFLHELRKSPSSASSRSARSPAGIADQNSTSVGTNSSDRSEHGLAGISCRPRFPRQPTLPRHSMPRRPRKRQFDTSPHSSSSRRSATRVVLLLGLRIAWHALDIVRGNDPSRAFLEVAEIIPRIIPGRTSMARRRGVILRSRRTRRGAGSHG